MSSPTARQRRRRKGLANYRLVRYADDWVAMVAGDRADGERLRDEAAAVLLPMGLRLSEEKTAITHIDRGFDFLGVRIQRHKKRGTAKRFVYTYPSKAALAAVTCRVRRISREVPTNEPLATLLRRLNPALRGWTNYHRHGVSKATFQYLCSFVWRRVTGWLRRKHPKANWALLRRRYLPGWWPTDGAAVLYNPSTVPVTRYRYRGQRIPTPWASTQGSVA
jgi:RNA-directed DNA polymerase